VEGNEKKKMITIDVNDCKRKTSKKGLHCTLGPKSL
jgi:hypothetical protein